MIIKYYKRRFPILQIHFLIYISFYFPTIEVKTDLGICTILLMPFLLRFKIPDIPAVILNTRFHHEAYCIT